MSEIKKTYIVDLNKLKALDSNGNIVSPHVYGGSSKAIVAYVYKNGELVKVYNQAEYVFEAETVNEVEATAQTIDPVVKSEKYDYNTETKAYDILADQNVPYEGVLELDANTSEDERTGTFTVRQPKSGLSFECSYRQAGAQVLTYYIDVNSVYVEGVNYDAVGAGGGTSSPYVTVKAAQYATLSSGISVFDKYVVGTSYVSYASGKAVDIDIVLDDYSPATINSSTGKVSVSSLTDNVTYEPITVFEVTSLKGGVLFENHEDVIEWQWSGSAFVEQDVNSYRLDHTDYFINSYLQSDTIEKSDTSFRVYGHAYKTDYYRYDAIAELVQKTSDITLYVTLNNAPESVLYIQGRYDTYVTFEVGANTTSSDRVFTVQAYSYEAGYSREYTVTQSARTFDHYRFVQIQSIGVSYEEAEAGGGYAYPYISIRAMYYAVYSDGYEDPTPVYRSYSDVSVTDASGVAEKLSGVYVNYSNATINSSGRVSVSSLTTNETDRSIDVYYVEQVQADCRQKDSNTFG